MTYQRYPLLMRHPQHQDASHTMVPGIIVQTAQGRKEIGSHTDQAKPQYLPDVTVDNEAQEKMWAGRGYVAAGEPNAEAYHAQILGIEAPDHSFHEYPKWMYHHEEEPTIVQSREEEEALGPGWSASPDGPFEDPPDSPTPYIPRAAKKLEGNVKRNMAAAEAKATRRARRARANPQG